MTPIITERLKLVSMSRACLQALYEGDYKKAQLIGGFVISPDCSLVKSVWLGHRLKMIAEDPDQLPWLYRAEVGIADNSAATYAAVSGSGANTLYMASTLCTAFTGQTTAYAIQNIGIANATVTVSYRDLNGNVTNSDSAIILPNRKASFNGCNVLPVGYTGSAVVTSVGAPIAGVIKVFGAGANSNTTAPSTGSTDVALPYVRWAPDANYNTGSYRRTFFAIQNVGSNSLPANSAALNFYDSTGTLAAVVAVPTLAPGQKVSLSPASAGFSWFGYTSGGGADIGGAVMLHSVPGFSLIALVRSSLFNGVSEDYIGVAF